MSFFAGQYTSVYSLNHHITCRFEARQALIYQLVLGLTGENDKYNYSKAVHVYAPFSDITCSAINYKIAPALTVSKAMGFVSSALLGLGQGFQPVCGFNYGAGKYDRVLSAFAAGLRKALFVMVSLSVLGFIFADGISGLVAGASPEAIKIASFTLRTQLLTLPCLVYVVFSNMLLQNIGATGGATLVALSRQGLTYAPTVLLLPLALRSLGLEPVLGLELSQAAADLMTFVIAMPIGLSTLRRMQRLADAAANSGRSP